MGNRKQRRTLTYHLGKHISSGRRESDLSSAALLLDAAGFDGMVDCYSGSGLLSFGALPKAKITIEEVIAI
jgi:hypothetical protein